ncbi:hypothetical protein O6P43_018479 [Quillaja saponaria]|uniref:Uncharacterized protein n=1 Tax=Quillaja saponaria TaxID=32244 RepID=A0AAD7LSI3_QUISA|nr:hypothetical protein O6P43_018479 [Quillaja saponaria]
MKKSLIHAKYETNDYTGYGFDLHEDFLSSWMKQETKGRKQISGFHQLIQKKLGRDIQKRRKKARNHGRVLWLQGGKLTRKPSLVLNLL